MPDAYPALARNACIPVNGRDLISRLGSGSSKLSLLVGGGLVIRGACLESAHLIADDGDAAAIARVLLHGLRLAYGLAHKPHQWPAPESLRGIRRAFLSLRLTSLSALGSMPLA